MKRAVAGASSLVGLVLVICAVMGWIVLGPHGTWQTTTHVPAGRGAVVVRPALASVLGPTVTITARTPDDQVQLLAGRARPDDAEALVETTDRFVVTGLDGARRLSTEQHVGNDPLPQLDQVDVWRSRTTGTGSVSLTYRPTRGAESVVVGRTDGQALPAMDLAIGWSDRSWFWIPSTLLLLGIGLLALGRRLRHTRTASAALPPTRPSARGPRPVPSSRSARRNQHVGRRRAVPADGRRR